MQDNRELTPFRKAHSGSAASGVMVYAAFGAITAMGLSTAVGLGGGFAGVVLLSLLWLVPFAAVVEQALTCTHQEAVQSKADSASVAVSIVPEPDEDWVTRPTPTQRKRPLSSPPQRMPSRPSY